MHDSIHSNKADQNIRYNHKASKEFLDDTLSPILCLGDTYTGLY